MTDTWLRVETDKPSRYLAPSHCPPASLEGIDKMFEAPFRLRSICCAAAGHATSESRQLVAVHKFASEEGLGTVSVSCGGVGASPTHLHHLVVFAMQALRSTSAKGASELLDSLVTRTSDSTNSTDDRPSPAPKTSKKTQNAAKFLSPGFFAIDDAIESSSSARCPPTARRPPTFWELQKCNVHCFVTTTAGIPLHPLYCMLLASSDWSMLRDGASVLSGGEWLLASPADFSSQASSPSPPRTSAVLTQKVMEAQRVYRGVVLAVAKLLSGAFSSHPSFSSPTAAIAALTEAPAKQIAFFAAYNVSGVVLSNKSFVTHTTQWEKLLLSSMAMDALLIKSKCLDTTIDAFADKAIRVTGEFPLRLSRSPTKGTVASVVLVSVGSALTVAVGLYEEARGGLKASAFSRFVREAVQESTADLTSHLYRNLCAEQTDVSLQAGSADVRRVAEPAVAPVFPGLHGRGSAALTTHVAVCTAQPDDALAVKLLHDLSSSDDDGETETMCGSCVGPSRKETKQKEAASEKRVSMLLQDTPESLLCRYSARLLKLEETFLSSLRAGGVETLHCLVKCGDSCSDRDDEGDGVLHQLQHPSFQAFQCSWWTHMALQGPPVLRHCGLGSLRPSAALLLLSDTNDFVVNAIHAEVPLQHCTLSVIEPNALWVSAQTPPASPSHALMAFTCGKNRAIHGEPASAVATTCAFVVENNSVSLADDYTEALQAGFQCPTDKRPGFVQDANVWKLLKCVEFHMSTLVSNVLAMQRRLVSDSGP